MPLFSGPYHLDAKRPLRAQQMGEGSYEGTREYQENIKSYLEKADVKSDAEAARPATAEEAKVLKKAGES